MSDLPIEGTLARPLRMGPGERIVEVHWGGSLYVLIEATVIDQSGYVVRSSDPLRDEVPRANESVKADPVLLVPAGLLSPFEVSMIEGGYVGSELKEFRVIYLGAKFVDQFVVGQGGPHWADQNYWLNSNLGMLDMCTRHDGTFRADEPECDASNPLANHVFGHNVWLEIKAEFDSAAGYRLVYGSVAFPSLSFGGPPILEDDLSYYQVQKLEGDGQEIVVGVQRKTWIAVFAISEEKEFTIEETNDPAVFDPQVPYDNKVRIRGYRKGDFLRVDDETGTTVTNSEVAVFDQTRTISAPKPVGVVARINRKGFVPL